MSKVIPHFANNISQLSCHFIILLHKIWSAVCCICGIICIYFFWMCMDICISLFYCFQDSLHTLNGEKYLYLNVILLLLISLEIMVPFLPMVCLETIPQITNPLPPFFTWDQNSHSCSKTDNAAYTNYV